MSNKNIFVDKNNENDGAVLVMVMVMLVIGSILVTTLLVSSRNYINTAEHEEAMSKSFYAANSGVEFIKSKINNIDFSGAETGQYIIIDDNGNIDNSDVEVLSQDDLEESEEIWIDSDNLTDVNSKINFNIKIKEIGEEITLISQGKYNKNGKEYSKKIKFKISNYFNKPFNLQADYNPGQDELKDIMKQKATDLYPEDLSILSNIYPGWNKWNDILKTNNWNNVNGYDIDGKIIKHDSDLELKDKDYNFNNSIIIIDGSLTLNPQISWTNSIIIIKGNLTFNGVPTHKIDNSVFFVYGENLDNNDLLLAVNGNINENWNIALDFDILPGELKDKNIKTITNWQQMN